MLSLYCQRKRQAIITGLLLHLRPQMNIFQNLWLLSKMCILPYPHWRFMASFSIPLCSVWFGLGKYLVLAHFDRTPAGFSVVSQISKQPCLAPLWKSIGELDVSLKKLARKKERTQKCVVFGKWFSSLMPFANLSFSFKRTHNVALYRQSVGAVPKRTRRGTNCFLSLIENK